MALVTDQIERSACQALERTQIWRDAVAWDLGYVDLHRAAVAAVATQPGLLTAIPPTTASAAPSTKRTRMP
jgi:hypothetical protein